MSHAPSTFRAEPAGDQSDWNDSATLHQREDGGVLSAFRAIRSGTLAELVRQVMILPAEERRAYAIEKTGDHRFEWREIEALAARRDFPS